MIRVMLCDDVKLIREYFEKIILELLRLLPRKYNEFIVYWLPRLQENPYNLITFQTEKYMEHAGLVIMPESDSLLLSAPGEAVQHRRACSYGLYQRRLYRGRMGWRRAFKESLK